MLYHHVMFKKTFALGTTVQVQIGKSKAFATLCRRPNAERFRLTKELDFCLLHRRYAVRCFTAQLVLDDDEGQLVRPERTRKPTGHL